MIDQKQSVTTILFTTVQGATADFSLKYCVCPNTVPVMFKTLNTVFQNQNCISFMYQDLALQYRYTDPD